MTTDIFDLAYQSGFTMTAGEALAKLREAMTTMLTERERDLLLVQVEGFLNHLRLAEGA